MNNRRKGLEMVKQVRKALEAMGHTVEGPGYKPLFVNGKMTVVHRDFFGVFDLISFSSKAKLRGHQVCSLENKQRNAKKVFESGIDGDLWCYVKGTKGFTRYWVYSDNGEMRIEWLGEVEG